MNNIVPAERPRPKDKNLREFFLIKNVVNPPASVDRPARVDNNKDTVRLILEEVVKEGDIKIPLLRELLQNGDIKRYAIEAHGVKGSMAGIAATSLSEHAKRHEFAAKGGDTGFIEEDIDEFLKEYESVMDYIRDYLKTNGS